MCGPYVVNRIIISIKLILEFALIFLMSFDVSTIYGSTKCGFAISNIDSCLKNLTNSGDKLCTSTSNMLKTYCQDIDDWTNTNKDKGQTVAVVIISVIACITAILDLIFSSCWKEYYYPILNQDDQNGLKNDETPKGRFPYFFFLILEVLSLLICLAAASTDLYTFNSSDYSCVVGYSLIPSICKYKNEVDIYIDQPFYKATCDVLVQKFEGNCSFNNKEATNYNSVTVYALNWIELGFSLFSTIFGFSSGFHQILQYISSLRQSGTGTGAGAAADVGTGGHQ